MPRVFPAQEKARCACGWGPQVPSGVEMRVPGQGAWEGEDLAPEVDGCAMVDCDEAGFEEIRLLVGDDLVENAEDACAGGGWCVGIAWCM